MTRLPTRHIPLRDDQQRTSPHHTTWRRGIRLGAVEAGKKTSLTSGRLEDLWPRAAQCLSFPSSIRNGADYEMGMLGMWATPRQRDYIAAFRPFSQGRIVEYVQYVAEVTSTFEGLEGVAARVLETHETDNRHDPVGSPYITNPPGLRFTGCPIIGHSRRPPPNGKNTSSAAWAQALISNMPDVQAARLAKSNGLYLGDQICTRLTSLPTGLVSHLQYWAE